MSIQTNRWLTWKPRQARKTEPTKPTKPPKSGGEGGFVGFEGRGEGPFHFIEAVSASSESHPGAPSGLRPHDLELPQAPGPFLRIKRKGPWGEPTKPPSLEECEAALAFVNRSAARLVCPDCHALPEGTRYAVLVPEVNDTPEFRTALLVLRLEHLPILHRDVPLGFRPEVEHRKRRGA